MTDVVNPRESPSFRPAALNQAQLREFQEHGFLQVRQAFSPEVAEGIADEVWAELHSIDGIRRGERSSWRQPARMPRRVKKSRLNTEMADARFRQIITDLRGGVPWEEPRDWGGFLITFPSAGGEPWDVPADTWHWDGTPATRGPFIFSFYSTVRPGGGGTLLLGGSQRLLQRFYAELTPAQQALSQKQRRGLFCVWDPWLAELTGNAPGHPDVTRRERFMGAPADVRGVRVRVVELCGEPGDAVFCEPLMLHAIARNSNDQPRIMRSKFFFDQ